MSHAGIDPGRAGDDDVCDRDSGPDSDLEDYYRACRTGSAAEVRMGTTATCNGDGEFLGSVIASLSSTSTDTDDCHDWRGPGGTLHFSKSPMRGRAHVQLQQRRASVQKSIGAATSHSSDARTHFQFGKPAQAGTLRPPVCTQLSHEAMQLVEQLRLPLLAAMPLSGGGGRVDDSSTTTPSARSHLPHCDEAALCGAESNGAVEVRSAILSALSVVRQSRSTDLCVLQTKTMRPTRPSNSGMEGTHSNRLALPRELPSWRISVAFRGRFPPGVAAVIERLVTLSNQVAKLAWYLRGLDHALGRDEVTAAVGRPLVDVTAQMVEPLAGRDGLFSASRMVLVRLSTVIRKLMGDFSSDILSLQQAWGTASGGLGKSNTAPAASTPGSRPLDDFFVYVASLLHTAPREPSADAGAVRETLLAKSFHGAYCSPHASMAHEATSLYTCVARIAIPLQRILGLVENSGCCDHLLTPPVACSDGEAGRPPLGAMVENRGRCSGRVLDYEESVIQGATRTLDHLVARISTLQEPSTMSCCCFYTTILVHLMWPYVCLMICVLHSLVYDIDRDYWRSLLPRAFRTPFSHLRVAASESGLVEPPSGSESTERIAGGERASSLPSDVLSLVLTCVGFEGEGMDASSQMSSLMANGTAGERAAFAQVTLTQLRATHAAMRSSRSFALRHLATFAGHSAPLLRSDGITAASEPSPVAGAVAPMKRRRLSFYEVNASSEVPEMASITFSVRGEPHSSSRAASGTECAVRKASVVETPSKGCHPGDNRSATSLRDELLLLGQLAWKGNTEGTCADTVNQLPAHRHFYAPRYLPLSLLAADDYEGCAPSSGSEACGMWSSSQPLSSLQRAWNLRIVDDASAQDILLEPSDRTSGAAVPRHFNTPPHRRQLWQNMTVPSARWIAAALLVPIGQLVRRVQMRRLGELLKSVGAPTVGSSTATVAVFSHDVSPFDALDYQSGAAANGEDDEPPSELMCNDDDEFYDDGGVGVGSDPVSTAPRQRRCWRSHGNWVARRAIRGVELQTIPSNFSFFEALTLLERVALLGETERLVCGFVERLMHEPHWWFRRDAHEFNAMGTASTFLTGAFAEAVRGMQHGNLVRLVVLPQEPSSTNPAPARENAVEYGSDILATFAAFRLRFTLPEAFAAILTPIRACFVGDWQGRFTQAPFSHLFWQQRTGPPRRAGGYGTAGVDDTLDTWSLLFGRLCMLYYAKSVLQDHRKRLQQRDVEAFRLTSLMGLSGGLEPKLAKHPIRHADAHARDTPAPMECAKVRVDHQVKLMSRGSGSAYYVLAFVADAMLRLVLTSAHAELYAFRKTLLKRRPTTYIDLCYIVDRMLFNFSLTCLQPLHTYHCATRGLESHVVATRSRIRGSGNAGDGDVDDDPVSMTQRAPSERPCRLQSTSVTGTEANAIASGFLEESSSALRRLLDVVLTFAVDPGQTPARHVAQRTEDSVTAIVEILHALPVTSVLRARVLPLITTLTFNQYFGEHAPSFRF